RTEKPAAYLEAWKEVFESGTPEALASFDQIELARDFCSMSKEFDIPRFALLDFIDKGIKVDLAPHRFQTPLDLEGYCYGVAGSVGLACLPIFGVPWQEAKEYAVRLGIAVQWTNTLRDVGVDAALGRIYLPLDHLKQFDFPEEKIFSSSNN